MRYHLDERHTGTIEVEERSLAEMRRFGGIFFHVYPLDPDGAFLSIGSRHEKTSFLADRREELSDLVVLRHVGIKVVLAIETRYEIHPRPDGETEGDGAAHELLVEHRQGAGRAATDGADERVGRGVACGRTAAKGLGRRFYLNVYLESDDRLIPCHDGTPVRRRKS